MPTRPRYAEFIVILTKNDLCYAVFALAMLWGTISAGQETTFSTTPLPTTAQVSPERLGTGVPSRLPKADVQRPVFTIQSGGPVAVPKPQFRAARDLPVTPSTSETKTARPNSEQVRSGQKLDSEKAFVPERRLATMPPTTPIAGQTSPAPNQSQTLPTANSPTPEQRISGTKPATLTKPLSVPAKAPATTIETPARVLNFSIN